MPFYLEPMSKGLATTSYWAHSWTSQHCSKWTICCSTIVIAHMNLVIRCSSRNRDGNRQSGTHIGSRQGLREHRHPCAELTSTGRSGSQGGPEYCAPPVCQTCLQPRAV